MTREGLCAQERVDILRLHARGLPLGPNVALDTVAKGCHGYSGADLAAVCREAAMCAISETVQQRLPDAKAGLLTPGALCESHLLLSADSAMCTVQTCGEVNMRQALQIGADMSCYSVPNTCDGLQPGWRVQQHLWWSPMITSRQRCSECLHR